MRGLVVDPEPLSRNMMRVALERIGIVTEGFADLARAVGLRDVEREIETAVRCGVEAEAVFVALGGDVAVKVFSEFAHQKPAPSL